MPKSKKPEISVETLKDFQASTSAVLYLLTEQQAMIGRLFQEMIRIGALNNESLARITDTDADAETRTSIYTSIYQKYAGYAVICRNIIDELDTPKDE